MSDYDALLKPFQLKHLTLRNRIFSTAHAPGFAEDGMPGERYQLYHEEKAKGGLALTMIGGSSSVSIDSPLPFNQIDISTDRILPYLESFSTRVHRHGAAIFCQITHIGRRASFGSHHWLPLISPSATREIAHRSYAKEMEEWDFPRVIGDFGRAALRLKQGGLDGVEVIAAAHHLIDSFLSPTTNKRTDKYGGSLENRARFGLEVFEVIRKQVGDDFIVGLRMSGDELIAGGLDQSECIKVATIFANSGLIDYISVYQGSGDKVPDLAAMLPDMSYSSGHFLYLPSAIRAEVDIPIFHASTIRDVGTANRAVADGHVDMIAMTRAHVADPHIVKKMTEGRADDIRQCVGANNCTGSSVGLLCIQNVATGREKTIPHVIPKAAGKRRIVVVGGGPAGLEAARVAADRGHEVVLFEKSDRLGGQIHIAATVPWRASLAGIPRWLEQQVKKKGVDIRMGRAADRDAVLAENPDVVIIATGGAPRVPDWRGSSLAVSTWDVLSGRVAPGANVLLYDEVGVQAGMQTADFLAERGAQVELVMVDRMAGAGIGGTNHVTFVRKLYKQNVLLTPDMELEGIYQEGNGLVAILRNTLTGGEEERAVDQVVLELGTLPDDGLYHQLKDFSVNRGEVDYEALVDGRAQSLRSNPEGAFQLFRIGDAVMSRDVHASIYDAMRIAKEL
jgi:2,4-dienoyl-CoA reductase-like NADH-dependent reductase (Old Yellow Enzyme family)/pyruvate/2-oxoglutarate dehydrogenase complex dihydrolipoamide dehydrogenase (E3) component